MRPTETQFSTFALRRAIYRKRRADQLRKQRYLQRQNQRSGDGSLTNPLNPPAYAVHLAFLNGGIFSADKRSCKKRFMIL